MSQTTDVDRLTEGMSQTEISTLAGELLGRVIKDHSGTDPLILRDQRHRIVGCFVPSPSGNNDANDATAFMAEVKRRIKNPPDRFLTTEEFFAAITGS